MTPFLTKPRKQHRPETMNFQEKIKSHSADLLLDICLSQKGSCSEVSQAVRFSICPRHSSLRTWPYNKLLLTGISSPFLLEFLGLAAPRLGRQKGATCKWFRAKVGRSEEASLDEGSPESDQSSDPEPAGIHSLLCF